MELRDCQSEQLAKDARLDLAGPAARKIGKYRSQIAAKTRDLLHQQQIRRRSIVKRLVEEEWAASCQDKLTDGFPGGKSERVTPRKPQNAGVFQKSRTKNAPDSSCRASDVDLANRTQRDENRLLQNAVPGYSPLRRTGLSLLEQRRIEHALQEQQRALLEGTPQCVAGRVHAGPSFRCRPAEVVFKGFEAGGVYRQSVEVTNVSLGFSTFRVLPLPEELENVLSVSVNAPGRMSAGHSIQLTVTFSPEKEEDVKSEVLLLSPTGPQSLPILCYRKRSVLSFYPPQQTAQSLLKQLKAGGSLRATRQSYSGSDFTKKSSMTKREVLRKPQSGAQPSGQDHANEDARGGVIYLSSGDIQLGEVAAVHLRICNSGGLPTAYRLFPVTPDEPTNTPQAPDISTQHQNDRPPFSEVSLLHPQEQSTTINQTGQNSRASSPEMSTNGSRKKEECSEEADEPMQDLSASAWLEALQGEAVVLAQRLRVSSCQNALSWAKLMADGLSDLLFKSAEEGSQSLHHSSAPALLSLKHTLVKNAAGELDPDQAQEISIVHAPTCTGRFLGFFSLQFSDPEHDEVAVVLDGQCVLPPVCVDSPQHDLGICVPDRVYRQQFHVKSNSTSTRALQVVSPKAEAGVLWVEPQSSFVQPQGLTSLTANLSLSFSFFKRHPQYVQPLPHAIAKTHPSSVAFKIPIQIKASDQILCAETFITGEWKLRKTFVSFPLKVSDREDLQVRLFVSGILTDLHLRLSTTALNFGISDGTTRRMKLLKIYNPSLLIACYVFRSSERALMVLEPPHFADIHERMDLQQVSENGEENSLSPERCGRRLLPEDGVNAADVAEAVPLFDADNKPVNPVGSGTVSPDSLLESSCLFSRRMLTCDDEAWDDLCQQLPPLDCGGTGVLLPGEERTFAVVLSPGSLRSEAHALQLARGKAVEKEGLVRLRVMIANQAAYEIKIPWTATVVESPVALLPAPSLRLPSVPLGQSVSATLQLRLTSSHLSIGKEDTSEAKVSSSSSETAAKKASHCAAVLVELKQPPQTLSALTITPLRVVLDCKRRSSSIFIRFAPTEQYVQLTEHRKAFEGDSSADNCDQSASPRFQDATAVGRDKTLQMKSINTHEMSSLVIGTARARDSSKKAAKTAASSPGDSKTPVDRAHNLVDATSKATKANMTPKDAPSERRASASEDSRELPAGALKHNKTGASAPALACRGETACKNEYHSVGEASCKSTLQQIAGAGGSRWTSHDDDRGDLFNLGSPEAYHHARWLIPMRVCRLTSKQLDFTSSGTSIESLNLSPDSITQSFIEVNTCATPVLVVASPNQVNYGSVMVGQRVCQEVVLACSSRGPSCHHSFQVAPLSLASRFSVVSAAREVTPERPLRLTISFQPNAARAFCAELVLASARTRLSIPLRGEGVEHTVDVVPTQAAYDMGAVVCPPQGRGSAFPSSTSYTVTLRNKTSTQLAFSLVKNQSRYPQLDCTRAGTGFSYFTCEPQQGIIPGLGAVEVTFVFRPLRPEGWLQENFALMLAASGQSPRVLTFFGLAVGNALYASLPAFSYSNTSLKGIREGLRCKADKRRISDCDCRASTDDKCRGSCPIAKCNRATCPACYAQLLPRLSAERGLLMSSESTSPQHRSVVEEGNALSKLKGTPPVYQQPQPSGASIMGDRKRPEVQQIIHIRFELPAKLEPDKLSSNDFSTGDIPGLATSTPEDKTIQESTTRQQVLISSPSLLDEKANVDHAGLQQEADVIVENETTRTIVVGGAWAPGRQGLTPYSLIKGDVVGTFEFTIESSNHSHMFTFEPLKGNLFLGSRQMIRVRFGPQTGAPGEANEASSHRKTASLRPHHDSLLSINYSRGIGGPQSKTEDFFVCKSFFLAAEAMREALGRIPSGSLMPQILGCVARLSLRGNAISGASQEVEIHLSALVHPETELFY